MTNSFDNWDTELYHHGILGQKWGVRRFQNKDGSYTDEGLRRRAKKDFYEEVNNAAKQAKKEKSITSSADALRSNKGVREAAEKISRWSNEANEAKQKYFNTVTQRRASASKAFKKSFGRSPESETELSRIDKRILRASNLKDVLDNRYTKKSQKFAKKLLGLRGSRKLYSNFAQNERHYETARSIVAKTIRDLSDEEYKKHRS